MKRLRDYTFVICFLILEFELRNVVVAQNCDNQTVQLCLSFLSNKGLDVEHVDDDLPSWNETEGMLRNRCNAFGDFSECMRDEIDQCTSKERGLYNGWINAYNFLCKQSNLTVVSEYLSCYSSMVPTVESSCRKIFKSKVFILTNGSSTIPVDKLADYCKLANTFFNCLNNTLTDNCEWEAANWQWTWDQKLNGALITSCQALDSNGVSNDHPNSAWSIALIVVLVLIAAIMMLAIVFLVVFLLRKKKERSRNQQVRRRAHAAAPPPPYSAVLYSSSEPGVEPQAHLVDSSIVVGAGRQDGGQEAAMHPPIDVFLPPPYMGERTPAPSYETIQGADTTEDRKTKENAEEEKEKKEEEEKREEEEETNNRNNTENTDITNA